MEPDSPSRMLHGKREERCRGLEIAEVELAEGEIGDEFHGVESGEEAHDRAGIFTGRELQRQRVDLEWRAACMSVGSIATQ